ncbi:hypothetical protein [Microvirga sp. M2]|uniref:hypothetical protein n=1 Tax=Microvirga sp. M2 TaxID=3073270 RepID=UPI0039C019ED
MAELALVTVLLALVRQWCFTPPPRALAPVADAAAAASVHLHTPNLMAQVTLLLTLPPTLLLALLPGRVGMARAGIVVASGRAEPVSPRR